MKIHNFLKIILVVIIIFNFFTLKIFSNNFNEDDYIDIFSYSVRGDLNYQKYANFCREILINSNNGVRVILENMQTVNSRVLWESAQMLRRIGKNGMKEMTDFISDTNTFANITVINVLGDIGDTYPVKKLETLLNSEHTSVRNMSVQSLGKIKSKESLPKLLSLVNDDNCMVRKSTIVSIGNISSNDTEVLKVLFQSINDTFYFVRFSAEEAIEKFNPEISKPVLLKKIKTESCIRRKISLLKILSRIEISNNNIKNIIELFESKKDILTVNFYLNKLQTNLFFKN